MTAARAAIARAVIALGSNLGDRESTIRAAVSDIDGVPGVRVVAASALVESAALMPEGTDESAPSYLNAVILAEVAIPPLDLLEATSAIELRHGRERSTVWGDRTLDIDLVVIGDLQLEGEMLTLPHPRAWQRSFVLDPWLQVDADAVIPGRGRVADLLAAAPDEVRAYPAKPIHRGRASADQGVQA